MKRPPTEDRLLRITTILTLLVVVGLGILLVIPGATTQITSTILSLRNRPRSYTFDGVTIKGPLRQEEAQLVYALMRESVKAELLPKTLWFQLAPKPDETEGPDAYIANWNKDGKPISILLGRTQDGARPSYIRIWTMPPGKSITREEADVLLSSIFSDEYRQMVGDITCREVPNPSGSSPMTECAVVISKDDGSLRGATVRAPFLLTAPSDFPAGAIPPEEVVIVASCLVPADGAPFYQASSCL